MGEEEKPKNEIEQVEPELIYGGKEREDDILADTMSVPFQVVKKFGATKETEWHNKLIFGDNLQALKFMMKDPTIKGKVKLVYIDPPFGTGDIYDAKGAPAYSAVMQGAQFIEFLRKRLIFLRELLAEDGSIYVRIDYHFGHYVKVIMDEIFGKNNFQNEIVVSRTKKVFEGITRFNTATDSVFFYTKTGSYLFNGFKKERLEQKWIAMHSPGIRWTRVSKEYKKFYSPHQLKNKNGEFYSRGRVFDGTVMLPPEGRHWTFTQERLNQYSKEGRIRLNPTSGMPEYLTSPLEIVDSNWTDIPGYSFQWDYPTENSEQLLERIVKASSNTNDLILDCFAGSGTTGAISEKLSRRWIMADSSKLAIYSIIKRLHSLTKGIGSKGVALKQKPFVLYNAGLYEDHDFILHLEEEEYRTFALNLFQVERKNFEINGLAMDGVFQNCPVKIFSQKGFLTEEYIAELHATVGEYLKSRMFIIAPASKVYFLQDYISKDGVRYYVLRIPYSVIDELHKKAFTRPTQATSVNEINQLIDQVGFDFIHPPKVKAKYQRRKPKNTLAAEELAIDIEEFDPVQRGKNPRKFENPRDALSMVFVDTDYNGDYFNMTHHFFADDIKKQNFEIRIPVTKLGKQIMIIYVDIFGNEAMRHLILEQKWKENGGA